MTTGQYGNRKGVTLIELIMVITVVGILATVSSMYIKQTIDLWSFLSFRSEAVAQGRAALLRMERDIRQIQNDTSVYSATAARFQFNDTDSVSINYQLSGSNLTRNSDVLAAGVSNLTFSYYDENNQVIANPDVSPNPTNIYRIDINVTIQAGGQTKTLKTQVHPRNL